MHYSWSMPFSALLVHPDVRARQGDRVTYGLLLPNNPRRPDQNIET